MGLPETLHQTCGEGISCQSCPQACGGISICSGKSVLGQPLYEGQAGKPVSVFSGKVLPHDSFGILGGRRATSLTCHGLHDREVYGKSQVQTLPDLPSSSPHRRNKVLSLTSWALTSHLVAISLIFFMNKELTFPEKR